VSMPDRRTVGELLADSEALARETLLDATLEQAPAMVRSWNQLVGSAAELWDAPKSGGRVMFGRCQSCLDHVRTHQRGPMMSVKPASQPRSKTSSFSRPRRQPSFGVSLRTIRYWVATRRIPSR